MLDSHTNLTSRQRAILAAATKAGEARILDLARDLAVSPETIRRDIRSLVAAGALSKRHGVVTPLAASAEAPFERRMRENATEKRAIARHVAAMIPDGASVMMDTGTTTSMLARELLGKRNLTVITNSSDVARTLAIVNGNKVCMAGGELNGDNGAAFGGAAIEFIRSFFVDFAVISIAAVDAMHGLMDYRLAEAEFARAVLGQGRKRLVVTDHSKFASTALVGVCGFADIDLMVTDRMPPADIAERLAAASVALEIAE